MTAVLLVGAGAVGVRAARQLVDTNGLDHLFVTDRDGERADELATALGASASAVPWDEPAPREIDALALAIPAALGATGAARAVEAQVPVAAVADELAGIDALLALDAPAREAGVAVAVGCGLVPGLSDVLARHAASALDHADEVHVARAGAGGDACIAAMRRMRRDGPLAWHDGEWSDERALGPELVWFPEPVGARECELVAPGVALLRDALPGVQRVTVRVAEPPVRSTAMALLSRKTVDHGWGATRVQVWGWRGDTREPVVYGVIERPAVAAGTVLAVTAARLAGLLPTVTLIDDEPTGAMGLGALVEPAPFLAELARRGVKAAAFEGVAVT